MAGSAAFFSSLEVTGSKRNVDGVESRDSSSKSEHTQAPLIVGAQAVLRAGITLEIGRFAAAAAVCGMSMIQMAAAAPADPFLAAVQTMKKSIGAVVCVKPHPGSERYAPIIDGTAFFTTRSGEFLTAAHVVRDFSPGGALQNCPMEVWFSQGPQEPGHVGFQMFPVSRCVSDNDIDVGRCATTDDLLTLTGVKFKPEPVAIDGAAKPDGSAIAVTGYPLSSMLPITSRGFVGAYQLDSLGHTELILDRAAWPGGSGSPVYDSQGKVVGLESMAGAGAASGISFARASSNIVRFLATHPLPSATPPPLQSAPPLPQPPTPPEPTQPAAAKPTAGG